MTPYNSKYNSITQYCPHRKCIASEISCCFYLFQRTTESAVLQVSLTLEPQDGFSLHKRTQRSHEVFSSAVVSFVQNENSRPVREVLWYHLLSMHAACTERKQQPIDKPFAIPHEGNMSLQCHCMLLLFSTCVYIYYIYIYHASHKDSTHSTRKHDDKNGAAWLWPHSTKRMHRLKIPRYSKIFQGLHSELGLVQRMLQQSAAIQHTSWVI